MRRLPALAAFVLAAAGCSGADVRLGEHPFLVAERTVWCGSSVALSFYPDGRVEQITDESCTESRKSHRAFWLRREDLEALQSLVERTRFFSLPDRLEEDTPPRSDDRLGVQTADVFSITAWSHGKAHSVAAQGLDRASPSPDVQRFLLVWSAVEEISGTELSQFGSNLPPGKLIRP
jgi:hypothetical protein